MARGKAKGKGKAKEVGEGSSAVVLSDLDGRARNKEIGKTNVVADDLEAELEEQLADQPAFDKSLSRLLQMFPDVCLRTAREDLASQMKKTSPGIALTRIIDRYLEHGAPKVEVVREPDVPHAIEHLVKIRSSASGAGTSNQGQREEVVVALEVIPPGSRVRYDCWSFYTLSNWFSRFPVKDLKRVYKANDSRFPPSFKAIHTTYLALLTAERNGEVVQRGKGKCHPALNLSLRGGNRHAFDKPREPCPLFERERLLIVQAGFNVEAMNDGAKEKEEIVLVESRTDTDAQGEGAGPSEGPSDIECGCCCSDYRFEEMVQCAEGHLFCFTCLGRRVQESTFGGSKASISLPCMDTAGCEGFFPWSEVRRALSPDLLAKYEQRQAEHAVVEAKIAGLVFCPFCSTPWQVDPDMSVLECANEKCLKASCIKCREPSHIPLRCAEFEEQSETASRRSIEERMTKAIVRECTACHTELLKNGGCNKVTCPCGQVMCYICREVITKTTYQHFCQCDRGDMVADGRNGPCKDCKKCRLYEQENEDKVASAAREAAILELGQHDPNLRKRAIGPALEELSKKQKPKVIPAVPFRPPPPEYYNRMAQAMIPVAEQVQELW